MRKQPLVINQYYHVYNRGVYKRDIFSNKNDVYRFIESIIEFNQINTVGSIRDLRKPKSQPGPKALAVKSEPLVSIIGYCLNPNHFHFILKQSIDGGIAKFMQNYKVGILRILM